MGYSIEQMRISARLSSHNSEQDKIDREAWENFQHEVRMLAETPEYKGIVRV